MKRITNETRLTIVTRSQDGCVTQANKKITAEAGFLNFLCTALNFAADRSMEMGCPAMSEEYRAVMRSLYNVLEFRGLYDNL